MEFDHVVIAVADLQASLGWYAALLETIGFRKTRAHVWLNPAGAAVEIRQASNPAHGYSRHGVGVNHLAFDAGSEAELQATVVQLRAAGLDVPPLQDFGDAVALFMTDRDGMRVELSVNRPAAPALSPVTEEGSQ